jgi:hypothetical protein
MRNLFDATAAAEVKDRLGRLRPDSKRQWGKMTSAQAVAHCSAGLEMALGSIKPPRVLMGRLIGGAIKRFVVRSAQPMRPNSPTAAELVVDGVRDFDEERLRLSNLIDRFRAGGEGSCTTHPHPFFGSLTPQEWSVLMYKHLDHHLRQFGE